jgi:hypothetical protein
MSLLSLELAPAAFALGVGRSGRGERGLSRDLGDVVEGLTIGFPDCVVRSLRVEDTADGLVVEELGAAEDEGVLEAGDGDLVGLCSFVSMMDWHGRSKDIHLRQGGTRVFGLPQSAPRGIRCQPSRRSKFCRSQRQCASLRRQGRWSTQLRREC